MSHFKPSAAFKVALIYVIAGFAWILGSDGLVEWWFADDLSGLQSMQTLKGLFFVSVMTVLLYGVVRHIGRLEARNRQMEAMLALSQKLEVVGSFAAALAHDLNNMLMLVEGQTQMAKWDQKTTSAISEKRLREIETAVGRAKVMLRQLSAFLRAEREDACEIDAGEVVHGFESLLRQAATKSVTFELSIAPDLPRVTMAPGALEQVLLNLVVNARDAMEGRSGSRLGLTIEPCRLHHHTSVFALERRDGDFLRIRVEDNGCGIEQKDIVRVFDPFYTTKPSGSGTGLGLASVMRVLKQHGGWVELESQTGEGTRFDLYLPVVGSEPAARL